MTRWGIVAGLLVAVAVGVVAGLWPRYEAARPPAAFAIRGTVTTVSGRPLPGARVELFAVDEAQVFTPLGEIAVRANGTYALPFTPPAGEDRALIVRASAGGCASESRTIELAGERGAQDFRLSEQAASVNVRVEDAAGVPRAGAGVLLTFEPVAAASDALYAWRLETDAAGAARFDGLPVIAGTLHVAAEHDRARVFIEHAKLAGAITTEVTAQLAAGRRVGGQLAAPGAPALAGAEVVLREAAGPWLARVTARADGSFDVPDAPIDTPLTAEVTGDWILAGDVAARAWRVPRADDYVLRLDVVPGGGIEGVVLDTQGTPLGGASVTVAAHVGFAGGARRVVTDPAGHFAVRGLPSTSTWAVEARYPGRAPARRTAVAARTRGLELRVARGGTLVGRVVDRGGHGVPDIEVYAHAVGHDAGRAGLATGLAEYLAIRTDADGRYRLGALTPGRYRFEVRPSARMQWSATASDVRELDVVDGDTPVADATVARGASLRGTSAARDATLELALLPADKDGNPHRVVVQPASDGAFTVDALEEGRYRLVAHSAALGYSDVAELRLVEATQVPVALRFAGTARLDGRVQAADGTPARNARIDVSRAARFERTTDDWTGNWAAAAMDGSFAIGGLAPGRWTVKVTSEDAAPIARAIDIAGTTHQVFTVEPGASLDVALAGASATGTVVLLEPGDPLGVTARGLAGADGLARFAHLPRGRYHVRAVAEGTPSATVELSARGTQRVELRVP